MLAKTCLNPTKSKKSSLSPTVQKAILGLRIDVDTYPGAQHGLPWLLQQLHKYGAKTSVFLPGGPDRTALAILRIFTQRGYLAKLLRTDAFRIYGPAALTTSLRYRNRAIASAAGPMRMVLDHGHEVVAHGFTHTVWHNRLHDMPSEEVDSHVVQSVDALQQALGTAPVGFGGPGWQANFASLAALDRLHLRYGSDARGSHPFLPVVNNFRFNTPQVPTTLPSLDEFPMGLPPKEQDIKDLFASIRRQHFPVFAAHAELEGRFYRSFFARLLAYCADNNIAVVPLGTLLDEARESGPLPHCAVFQGSIPNRPGVVACQGEDKP